MNYILIKQISQYLNHMDKIKFLHFVLCFNLPLIVLVAHDVPSKWDLLKLPAVGHQRCESDAESRRQAVVKGGRKNCGEG